MTPNSSFERRLTEYYANEPPLRAPDRVLLSALATIDTTRQRRGLVAPWRFRLMSTNMKLAAAAVAVIALGLGVAQLQPKGGGPGGPGGSPRLTPTVAPSATPTPTVTTATAKPAPTAPPLTGSHVSDLYGLTLSYPEGWTVDEGTEAWSLSALPGWGSSLDTGDYMLDGTDPNSLFILVSSHALEGQSGSAWAEAINAQPDPGLCSTFDTIVVDGLDGRVYGCDEPLRALFWSADRGYLVAVHRSDDDPSYAEVYDRAWLDNLLETVSVQ